MTRAWLLLVALSSCTTVGARPVTAHGDETRATAQALFDEARALMAQGKDDEACPKLAESQRLDPSLGTLLRLATCYERIGRTASAWALFGEAAAGAKAAGESARERYALEHAAALAPRLCRLTITVPAMNQVTGLQVSRDGRPVSRVLWGAALPVDPGTVTIEASAAGKLPWRTAVTFAPEGTHLSVTVPALSDAPKQGVTMIPRGAWPSSAVPCCS